MIFQVQMERLSFISGSSANEEDEEDLDDEDDEDPMAAFLPPPPLPPKPAVLLNQQPRNSGGGGSILHNPLTSSEAKNRELTPMVYSKHHFWMPEASDLEQIGTVRRKAKRERNRTEAVVSKEAASSISTSAAMVAEKSSRGSSLASTLSKSRSKSRSPGRSIESNRSSASSRPLPCSHHGASSSRGNSPDNISESSASFHENELIQQHQPQAASASCAPASSTASSAQIQAHFRPQQGHTTQGSSSSSSSMVPAPQSAAHPHSAFIYANRDSVRESWISSGSSDHPPPQVYYRRQQVQQQPHPSQLKPGGQPVSSGGTSDASNKSISSGAGGPHFQRQKQPSSKAEISMVGGGSHYAKAPVKVSSMTLPRAANTKQPALASSSSCLRHSQQKLQQHQQQHSRSISRESGSSSSRTVSRSGSRSAGLLPQSRSGSSSALASRPRSGTPQGKTTLTKV